MKKNSVLDFPYSSLNSGENEIENNYSLNILPYIEYLTNKEQQTKFLLDKQKDLEDKNFIKAKLLIFSFFLIIILLVIIINKKQKEKRIEQKYLELEKKILHEEASVIDFNDNKIDIPENVVNDLLLKLEKFEAKKEFRKKGLTLSEMAKKFKTNTTYLSQIINTYKGKNFNGYLNELRINYITYELIHNPKFLEYTIEGLAEDCGVSSRQNFSNYFNEINGIRPNDFIKNRKTELLEELNRREEQ